MSRLGATAVALLASAAVLSGCVKITNQSAQQLNTIGDVQLTTTVCVTGPSTCSLSGTNAGFFPSGDSQLLVAYRIPDTVQEPSTLTGTYASGGSGSTPLSRSSSYTSQLSTMAPPAAGRHWAGYISPAIDTTNVVGDGTLDIVGRFGLKRGADGSPFASPMKYTTVVGGREADDSGSPPVSRDPTRPVACGSNLFGGSFNTICVDSPTTSDVTTLPELSIATKDVGVRNGGTAAVPRGHSVFVPFKVSAVNPTGLPVFSTTASTTAPGASAKPFESKVGPQTNVTTVGVNVPASTPPGTYNVSLTAHVGATQIRVGTSSLTVSADRSKPALTLLPMGGAKLGTVLKKGFPMGVGCSEACTVRIKLGKLSSAKLDLSSAGYDIVTARFSKKVRNKLKRRDSLKFKITAVATDSSGNATKVRNRIKLFR